MSLVSLLLLLIGSNFLNHKKPSHNSASSQSIRSFYLTPSFMKMLHQERSMQNDDAYSDSQTSIEILEEAAEILHKELSFPYGSKDHCRCIVQASSALKHLLTTIDNDDESSIFTSRVVHLQDKIGITKKRLRELLQRHTTLMTSALLSNNIKVSMFYVTKICFLSITVLCFYNHI